MADLLAFARSMSRLVPLSGAERQRRHRQRKAVSRNCERCGESFTTASGKRFCSALCRLPLSPVIYARCAMCTKLFTARGGAKTCSAACSGKYRSARVRNREHIRRTALSDITPEQELALRRRARTCPLCGVRLTSRLGLPNSKHLDHIVPLAVGGTHTHGNVRIVCRDCNLRRPKDGSDLAGQITLWAQGPVLVSRPDRRHERTNAWTTCQNGLHPWIPANIKITASGKKLCRACYQARERQKPSRDCAKCGMPFPAPGRQHMCLACVSAAAHQAAALHAAGGLTWAQVAARVGYASGEGARFAAKRAGYVPAPRPKAAEDERSCPDCASPLRPPGTGRPATWCQACTTARAWRAVELRRGGLTLREIAAQLGYGSITSVTSLMKTVVAVEPRMGRPPKMRTPL